MKLKSNHNVLDLCTGNGLIAKEIIGFVNSVVAVDVSKKLLDSFVVERRDIKKVQSDILEYQYPTNYFDRVILYFSAQHFNENEMAKIFDRVYNSLIEGGIFYVGDIPDISKRWDFYNKKEFDDKNYRKRK
jgi:cyclopropane fatty-acyl-phospholipid synthase-like methyltransferase